MIEWSDDEEWKDEPTEEFLPPSEYKPCECEPDTDDRDDDGASPVTVGEPDQDPAPEYA